MNVTARSCSYAASRRARLARTVQSAAVTGSVGARLSSNWPGAASSLNASHDPHLLQASDRRPHQRQEFRRPLGEVQHLVEASAERGEPSSLVAGPAIDSSTTKNSTSKAQRTA